MGSYSRRLERIEESITPRFPWERVCYVCQRKGLTETPYEHCEAKRCTEGKRALETRISPEQAALMRERFEEGCVRRGTTYEAEMEKARQEDEAEREAWRVKKAAIRAAIQRATGADGMPKNRDK